MNKVSGGKAVYGASIGILMLETRFPRIRGDGGNAATWPFPMLYKLIKDASPERVVRQGANDLRENVVTKEELRVEMAPIIPQIIRDSRSPQEFNARVSQLAREILQNKIDRILI